MTDLLPLRTSNRSAARPDGGGDGGADPFAFADAVNTAAVILRQAKGAPPAGGTAAPYAVAQTR